MTRPRALATPGTISGPFWGGVDLYGLEALFEGVQRQGEQLLVERKLNEPAGLGHVASALDVIRPDLSRGEPCPVCQAPSTERVPLPRTNITFFRGKKQAAIAWCQDLGAWNTSGPFPPAEEGFEDAKGAGPTAVPATVVRHGRALTVCTASAYPRSRVAAFDPDPAHTADTAAARPEPNGGGQGARRVLVVDDDPHILDLITKILERSGAKVSAFAEPKKALAETRDGRFDLAMFDILMPDISGTELYDRALGNAPSLRERVLFISSQSSDDRLKARLTSRGGRLLRKPFSVDELMAAMRETVPVEASQGR